MEETKAVTMAVEASAEPLSAVAPDESAVVVESDMDKLRREHREELDRTRIRGEVRYQLARLGAKNPDLAAKALDLSAITVEGETVTGAEELVKSLWVSDPYLFAIPQPGPHGGEYSSGAVHGEPRTDPDALSDREYYAMKLCR